jgi:hypothetical protein
MKPDQNLENDSQFTKTSHTFFWPILLIILGFLLLFNNFDILPWTIWQSLIHFWPIILILIGLEILLGRSKISNVIVTLVGLIVLLTILFTNIPQLTQLLQQLIGQLSNLKIG